MEEIFRVKEKNWAKRTTFDAAIGVLKNTVIFNSKVCVSMSCSVWNFLKAGASDIALDVCLLHKI